MSMPYALDPAASYLRNAYHLAHAARAVYSHEPANTDPALRTAFSRIVTFSAQRVFGFVAGNDRHVILAFRGSAEDREWVRGLSYGQIRHGGGRVHRGLYEALDLVWTTLLAAFYDVDVHDKTLWLTGHSLGGSLATVATHRLAHEGFAVEATYTYGAPRVLDPQAARASETTIYRFVNDEDIVPELPWPSFTDRYEHAGEKVMLLASGRVAAHRHSPGLARRIDRAHRIGDGPHRSGVFHDHKIDSYIAKLRRHL